MEEKKEQYLNDNGFSLIELIVVILIMGILMITLTPKVIEWSEKSRIAVDRNSLAMVQDAVGLTYTNSDIFSSANEKLIKITITQDEDETKIEADSAIKSGTKSFEELFEEYAGGTIDSFVFKKVHKAVLVYKNGLLLPSDISDTEIPIEFVNDLSD